MMALTAATSPLSSESKRPPKSNPPPPSPLDMLELPPRLLHRADRAQVVNRLLDLRVHVVRGELLRRSHQRERAMVTDHVHDLGVGIGCERVRVDAAHVAHVGDSHEWIHVLLLTSPAA